MIFLLYYHWTWTPVRIHDITRPYNESGWVLYGLHGNHQQILPVDPCHFFSLLKPAQMAFQLPFILQISMRLWNYILSDVICWFFWVCFWDVVTMQMSKRSSSYLVTFWNDTCTRRHTRTWKQTGHPRKKILPMETWPWRSASKVTQCVDIRQTCL